MILLTRLNGPEFALNPDLIERADQTPDTVITLVDGTKYIIAESLSEFLGRVRRYRAELIADAEILVSSGTHRLPGPGPGPADADQQRVVRLHRQER
ncbi:flagellar FlbD family protein [Planomonospora sp. ID82291]|uniref:flagellar FlbD family protein n=1 Tax=Planomonospora sp. ID82291 TaxID=2738136 RepID=UPI0018C441DF|nr:flagellar FlbD family protein [Planomonospora sp. ID82291]MBG0818488.1 flagellar FlbD family protein [Planomonospora sp. ID82291]